MQTLEARNVSRAFQAGAAPAATPVGQRAGNMVDSDGLVARLLNAIGAASQNLHVTMLGF